METVSTNPFGDSDKENKTILLKLVYFWAFIEAGLGGLLHLLHIPLTGFLVGGFAVIILVLLAKFGNNKAGVFLKALGIVLAVKFLLSPYTPFGAYIAVSFQGLLAVCIFSVFGLNRVTIFLFATLVMLESGIQKPLVAYLVFGKEFWQSAAALVADAFSVSGQKVKEGTVIFLSVYLLLYFLWGAILSYWADSLQRNIKSFQPDITDNADVNLQLQLMHEVNSKEGISNKKFITGIIILLLFILFSLLVLKQPVLYVGRTLLILFLLVIIAPILIRKHQFFLVNKNKQMVTDIVNTIPSLKNKTLLAWKLAEPYGGLKKMRYFVTCAIWLNVFYEPISKA